MKKRYDVIIIGGGLAGLSLARQLLLQTGRTVLVLDREPKLPINRQKVGESNVQIAGYYFGKVLDLEEHLFHEHVMKYNLRFMWKAAGADGRNFEDFSHSYIRHFSNIPCYQLDRNKFEAELIRQNRENPNHLLLEGISELDLSIEPGGEHTVRFDHGGESHEITAGWLVDTTGRIRHLAGRLDTRRESEIRHSATFFWTEGTVNIEKLSNASPEEIRRRPERASLGHLPLWLATNHFMGEGFWFWVIPLQGRTSFGLVYDNRVIEPREVSTKERMLAWLFREFPLFQRELENREIIDFQVLQNFSHDCVRTIHPDRWAMSGFAGRFTDPLYSPGGDAIAIHNSLITDAIETEDAKELASKLNGYETMMKVVYRSFVPSFHHSYNALGDQETFSLKYVWELSIYFSFYVFPFINNLYTDRLFLIGYLRRFSQLGPINETLLKFIADYYDWKKTKRTVSECPVFFELGEVATLQRAESTFYRVGLDAREALEELDRQLENLRELARFCVAHVSSVVAGDPDLVRSRAHAGLVDLEDIRFDSAEIRRRWGAIPRSSEDHLWTIDTGIFARHFHEGVPA